MRTVAETAGKRVAGASVSRSKALLAAVIVGVGAAVAAYKFLRSGGEASGP